MENFLIGLLAIGKTAKFFIGGSALVFLGLMLIQLISYQIFNYNIYKKICKFLFD